MSERLGALRNHGGYPGAVASAVIVSAVRTPFARIGGGLADVPATELGAIAIRAALERAGVDPTDVGYVVMGQVLQAGAGQAPARQAAIAAGIPKEVPADTINKVCASSIRAIEIAELMVGAGRHDVVVTGGMESMSRAPYLLPKARFGYRMGNGEVLDHMVFDGLTSSFDGLHMIQQASAVSRELGISREEQDAWAVRSHERAAAAQDAGRFDDELIPVGDVTADESVRRDTTLEKLAALKPVFDPEGTTTAGNAPGVTDGASCVIVCSEEWARERGIEPLARLVGHAYVADEFAYLARTPARAADRALTAAGRTMDDVARVEINEAFASVAKSSTRTLGADEELVNVNGGAVALGHPIGASGGRIVGTLVHELRRNGGGLGLAAICSGGGQGDAVLVEV
jgi:acetyl-CoA C-acetyltransferase